MKKIKICMISSSGGHYEQLKQLRCLGDRYDLYWVTEKTKYTNEADYFLPQTGLKDYLFPIKMFVNLIKTLRIWFIERPDVLITTGTMVILPHIFLAKVAKKKIIYIETFARVTNGTKTGKLMYKLSDLFIIQWEELQEIYPEAIFGGSIY